MEFFILVVFKIFHIYGILERKADHLAIFIFHIYGMILQKTSLFIYSIFMEYIQNYGIFILYVLLNLPKLWNFRGKCDW